MLLLYTGSKFQQLHDEDRKASVESAGDRSEIKRLRMDIDRLEEENRVLQMEQMQRETEIRAEVSAEMAERGSFLLEQMQQLQDQLMAVQERNDVTKSVKKLRQQQSTIQTNDLTKDLKEAEEEIERMKQEHAKELAAVNAEKTTLQVQLQEWKSKAEAANRSLQELQAVQKTLVGAGSNLGKATDSLSSVATGSQAASEFSQRMQRDQRFKRALPGCDENDNQLSSASNVSNASYVVPIKIGRTMSPLRSPLGTLRNDANSPIRLDTLNMAIKKKSPVKRTSGGRNKKDSTVPANNIIVNDENSATGAAYSTRLRGMLAVK